MAGRAAQLSSSGIAECFAQSYAEARAKFLAAAAAAGLTVQAHPHPLPGRDGELLALDVAREGATDAQAVLVISSGCHGVEGFCGSGIQVHLLRCDAWRARAREAGVAVLYLHALNPHGFSWWRRTTHENVDLNRNFQDFSRPLPANPAYDDIAEALVPPTWPPRWRDHARIAALLLRQGVRGLQTAISAGQYRHPDGLFFGGTAATWSQRVLRQTLREHGTRAARLAWIDLHSGLGKPGVAERILACRENDAAARARAGAWWGCVTSVHDGSSTSAPLTGLMYNAAYDECPQAEYTGIAMEYGTQSLLSVITALRVDQWLQNHPHEFAMHGAQVKRRIRDAFYVDTDAWKRSVVEQALASADDAVRGLSKG